MNIDIKLNNCPKDDFYLQWCYIYWWQLKINIEIMVKREMEKLNKESKE